MADVTRFDSTRFVNYKNGVFNSLHGWLPWQRAYFEDYCFKAIRRVAQVLGQKQNIFCHKTF